MCGLLDELDGVMEQGVHMGRGYGEGLLYPTGWERGWTGERCRKGEHMRGLMHPVA
jgi:hypothetical protein